MKAHTGTCTAAEFINYALSLSANTLPAHSRKPRVHVDKRIALCCPEDKCLTLLQLLGILVMVNYGFFLGKCNYWKKM